MPDRVQDPDVLVPPWFHRTKFLWKYVRNPIIRSETNKYYRKRLHKWWYYDPKPYGFTFVMLVGALLVFQYVSNTLVFKMIFRIPTNNINTIVHEEYYLTEKNKSVERANNLSKLMKDSNYFNALKGDKKSEEIRNDV